MRLIALADLAVAISKAGVFALSIAIFAAISAMRITTHTLQGVSDSSAQEPTSQTSRRTLKLRQNYSKAQS